MKNSENNQKKTIVYVGEDPEFIKEMNFRLQQKGVDAEYCQRSYYPGALLDIAVDILPNVIIFEIPQATKSIINAEILFLKKVPRFKPIMVIGIFPDKETLEACSTVASCGVSFFYIKGSEYEHLFRDCQLYGLEQNIMVPSFAKASGLKIKRKVNAISSISAIGENELYLDTDVGLPWVTSLNLSLNFLNDDHIRSYEVIAHQSFSVIYPMMENYVLKYPIAGPWDEPSDETIDPSNISDFIENYQQGFDSRSEFVWLFSSVVWAQRLFLYSLNCPLYVEVKSLENAKELNDLESKKPRVIFIETTKDDEQEHLHIYELIDKVRRIENYDPIIFILNTTFSSHDLKVSNNYGNIISSSKILEFDFFSKVISTLGKKEGHAKDCHYFRIDDIKRCLNFELEVTLLSITEHEIEFELGTEVPLFSLFQLSLPDHIFITVTDIESRGDNRFHYTGILHGMDELAYQNLRKIVNQLIYNPKNDLTPEEIQKILHSSQANTKQTIAKIESATKVEASEENRTIVERTFSRAGRYSKSKL